MIKSLKAVFSASVLLSVLGGAVMFLLFIIAMLMGGEKGQDLALFARNSFLPWVIRLATLGVGAGLLGFYLGEGHSLSLKDHGKEGEP
ncbi:hypothetical protein [Dethiosulfatarculus sandiegensis]|uniref:Uncharacterized protein n=1 Tax=Dethiosulfatarculus sandiegensis TaxID=1429043 RepID=A0A0D2JWF5_9BACT|nr:hypothetical protein [Dethiosulfatarculus sandiegensis]KIX13915.1 hypothetical protein X474_12120 [Dethiosulfatarculus sandiegensis]